MKRRWLDIMRDAGDEDVGAGLVRLARIATEMHLKESSGDDVEARLSEAIDRAGSDEQAAGHAACQDDARLDGKEAMR